MEARARAAAAASRAKSSDSDAITTNYLTPGLAGQTITTVDGSRSFTPNLACQKTASLLEVIVQPDSGGDLASVSIARDTDLDGTIDSRSNLPVPVSGICANGVISCEAGTWNGCKSYSWNSAGGSLSLAPADLSELAGCYCINASCGAGLAWSNMSGVLRDLGGGMIGALTSADPRYGVAEAVIDGPSIRYVGAQSTACTSDQALPQSAYKANSAAMASDAFMASSSSAVFQALVNSQIGTGTSLQYRHCNLERTVTVVSPKPGEIISRNAGGYATGEAGNSLDFLMGSPSDNSLAGGSCSLVDFRMTLHVSDPTRIVNARLTRWYADDWGQVRIDGQVVASGPQSWTSSGVPPAKCEQKKTYTQTPNLDIKPFLSAGDHEVWLRVAVAAGGEGFAQIHVDVDNSCKATEQLVDGCANIASDTACRIDSETIDGVQTFLNGAATGLKPLTQTRQMGGSACPIELTRDFFLKDRTYRCSGTELAQPDTSRGAYILDRSTETLLADRTLNADGSHSETTRPFALPDRGTFAACEPICKTRKTAANDGVAADGPVAEKQNVPVGTETFYHACGSDNQCPAGPGEEIVSACGCLDDFPEAVVMMQSVRLAGADLVCTQVQP
ncbi:hypothetical protein CA833_21375 [Novosphingobium sp. KA1]|nr:hypothetical protein [Novosphingobium sp. KA1]QSR19697.1 hypothetical protein CA833_21375 [Novosphingobium sp. KA1]